MSYDSMEEAIPTMSYEDQIKLMAVLVEAIKSHLPNVKASSDKNKNDYTDSYPSGYFDLFGSDPTYPDEPKELSWELESRKEFF